MVNQAGMTELMSVDDCTMTMKKWVGNKATDIPIAVVRDVSVAKSRENKYMNTWGTQEDVFFVRGRTKVTGKFTFFALTQAAWEMMNDVSNPADTKLCQISEMKTYSIYGTFCDPRYTKLQYIISIEGIVLESDDFSFNLDAGPNDMTFNYRARRVNYLTEPVPKA